MGTLSSFLVVDGGDLLPWVFNVTWYAVVTSKKENK